MKGQSTGKLTGREDNFPALFNHLEESFSYKEVQFKKFCQFVRTSYLPAENVNETPVVCKGTLEIIMDIRNKSHES